MSRQKIEALLADADAALAAGRAKDAEQLYNQAADLAVTDDERLFGRALEGIEQSRKADQAGPPPDAPVAQPDTPADSAAPDWQPLLQARARREPLAELVESRKLLHAGIVHDADGADLAAGAAAALGAVRDQALAAAEHQWRASASSLEHARQTVQADRYPAVLESLAAALALLEPPAWPSDLPAADSAQLGAEFADDTIRFRQQDYRQQRRDIAAEQRQVAAAHEQYAQARHLFEQADYAGCAAALRAIRLPESIVWPAPDTLLAEAEQALQSEQERAALASPEPEPEPEPPAEPATAEQASAAADDSAAALVSPAPEPEPPPVEPATAEREFAAAGDSAALASSEPEPLAPPAEPPAFTSLDDATHTRVEQLVTEAEFYLSAPSNDNYKKAVALYERILGFDISPSQRQFYDKKINEVNQAREQYLAKYGELITAKQINDNVEEVIAVRKLLNSGETVGLKGESLDDTLTDLFDTLRKKIQSSADELVGNAKTALADGLRFLEDGQFDTAIEYYNHAIRLVNGADFDRPNADAATRTAVAGIKNNFASEALKEAQKTYAAAIARVRDLQQRVRRIRPLYERAEQEIERDSYAKAVDALERALDEGGDAVDWSRLVQLRDLARTRWERQTLVQADSLLADARLARSRADLGEVQQIVKRLRSLEPHLNSLTLAEKQRQGEVLLDAMIADEQHVRQQSAAAEQLLSNNALAEAEQAIRSLMSNPLGKPDGQHLLDRLIHKKVKRSVREAETSLYGTDKQALHAQRDLLNHYLNDIGEVSNQREKRNLQEDIELSVAQIKQRLSELEALEGRDRQVAALLKQAAADYEELNYEAALKSLDDALRLSPAHPEAVRTQNTYRAEWLDALRRKMKQLLTNPAANVDALEQTLGAIKANLEYTDPDVALWQKTIDRVTARRNGFDALSKGEYQRAIEALAHADGADPEVVANLKEARFKLGERAFNEQRWAEAVQLLNQTETSRPQVKALLDRAASEFAIQQAVQFRQDQQFDQALRLLHEAQSHAVADLADRIGREQERTVHARAAAQRLKDLSDQVARAPESRTDLLRWIAELKREREALAGDDALRGEPLIGAIASQIAAWQDSYKQLVSSERAAFIRDGRAALHNGDPVSAIESFHKALALSATTEDSEVDALIKQAQHKIVASRDQLVATIKTFLRSQQMTLAECENLLEAAKAGLNWDAARHQPLVDASAELEKTHSFLRQVERYLLQARTSWFNARQKNDLDFSHAEGLLQQAAKEFDLKPSNHADLDLGSNRNLHTLMREDGAAIRLAARLAHELIGLIKGPLAAPAVAEAQRAFEALQQSEEAILKITTELSIKIHGQFMPPRLAERLPRQHQILSLLVEEINEAQRRIALIEDIELWRVERQRVASLTMLFGRWNPDDRFGLQDSLRA